METLSASIPLMQALGQDVLQVSKSLQQVKSTVAQVLNASAEIQSISRATRLIAINAGVEAARAGQAGAGFAVISSSIKQLSDQVGGVAADNAKNLGLLQVTLDGLIGMATRSTANAEAAVHSSTQAQDATQKLKNLTASVKELNSVIGELEEPVRINVESVEHVNESVASLSVAIQEGAAHLGQTRDSSDSLLGFSEDMMRFVVESGFKTKESGLITLCQHTAATISELFEKAVASGRITQDQLFDSNYVPIAGTNPQQYMTAFTLLTDELLTPIHWKSWLLRIKRSSSVPALTAMASYPRTTSVTRCRRLMIRCGMLPTAATAASSMTGRALALARTERNSFCKPIGVTWAAELL